MSYALWQLSQSLMENLLHMSEELQRPVIIKNRQLETNYKILTFSFLSLHLRYMNSAIWHVDCTKAIILYTHVCKHIIGSFQLPSLESCVTKTISGLHIDEIVVRVHCKLKNACSTNLSSETGISPFFSLSSTLKASLISFSSSSFLFWRAYSLTNVSLSHWSVRELKHHLFSASWLQVFKYHERTTQSTVDTLNF